jgi:hypothetical protein
MSHAKLRSKSQPPKPAGQPQRFNLKETIEDVTLQAIRDFFKQRFPHDFTLEELAWSKARTIKGEKVSVARAKRIFKELLRREIIGIPYPEDNDPNPLY